MDQGAHSEALRASEERYRVLFDSAPDAVLHIDAEAFIVNCSQSAEDLYGYEKAELIGKRLPELMTPTSVPVFLEKFPRLRQLEPQEGEIQIIRRDGTVVDVWRKAVPTTDSEGRFVGGLAFDRDITDRKRAEEDLVQYQQELEQRVEERTAELARANERLQAVFGSMADFLMLLDRDHRIRLINRVEVGQERDDVIGKPLFELAPPESRERVKGHLDRVVNGAKRQEWDTVSVRPDGSKVHFSSIAVPISVSGEVTGSVVSSRDVTDRIRLEKEKDRLEDQYRQSQKMESIGRLAGGVAHDFNNLLTVINSYAEFAADDLRDGDPLKADMQEILDAGQRAATLTRQLLAFSRKQVMEPKVLDLNEVVGDLEKMLRRLLGEDIELSTSLAVDLGRVTSDPGQIEQVLMNLAVNARDAMPSGGKLTIETANVELDEEHASTHPDTMRGHFVMLAVTDNGAGMTAEVKERIFEPFFTTKDKGQGTGLGLSTVYGIVKQSGGNILVCSEPGLGTTFKVYLPRGEAEKTEQQHRIETTDLRGTETVLIVEDERAVRDLAKRILATAGYNMVTASNGGEALLECERRGSEIQLVVTDVVMPKMSGKELARRLTKLCPEVKVLYMSGYTDDAIVHHGVLDEGTHFIAKPFTSSDLLRKVRMVLDAD